MSLKPPESPSVRLSEPDVSEPEKNFALKCAFNYLNEPQGFGPIGDAFIASGIFALALFTPIFGISAAVLGLILSIGGAFIFSNKENPKFDRSLYHKMHDNSLVRLIAASDKIYLEFRFESFEGNFNLLKTKEKVLDPTRRILRGRINFPEDGETRTLSLNIVPSI